MIDRSVVKEIRDRVDLVELVGQYVPLRRVGRSFIARCPFHDEKTPSFNVNPDSSLYHCFGCKASGDAFRFYENMEGVGFGEALRALAERAGVELPDDRDPERIAEDRRQRDVTERLHAVCEAAAVFFERMLVDGQWSELARGALEERGIAPEVAAQFRLGYAPARWEALAEYLRGLKLSPADAELAGLLMAGRHGSWYDRFRHRLMFPIFDRGGKVVAFSGRILPLSEDIPEGIVPEETGKYINSPETPIYHKGDALFGLQAARLSMRQRAEAIVVEGNFDVVQMHQHGFTETVAPLGTSFTEAQGKLLRRFAETVTLVFDGDEAGRKAARGAHAVCAKAGLVARVGVLPPKQDPDSYLRSADPAQGREGMARVLAEAPGIVEWLIKDAAATCGDITPERVAAVRFLAPTIAAVRDGIERDVYIRQAAKSLYLDEAQVRMALREYVASAAQAARESPFVQDDVKRRPGLTVPESDGEDLSPKAQKTAMATAIEALLVCPELLETAPAAELLDLLGGTWLDVVREARRQWMETQKLDGPELLARAPDDKTRRWISARLVPVGEPEKDQLEHHGDALAGAVLKLRRCLGVAQARVLKQQSARAGTQGDPAGELGTLNEQLRLKREVARTRSTKGGN